MPYIPISQNEPTIFDLGFGGGGFNLVLDLGLDNQIYSIRESHDIAIAMSRSSRADDLS